MQYRGIDITRIDLTTRDLMRQACKTHRDKPYLIYAPRHSEDTFGQFEEKVNRISHLLKDDYGVKKGDKICTISENVPELLYTIMAIMNIGALWVPINSMLLGESMKYVIEASGATCVCATQKYKVPVKEVLQKVKIFVTLLDINELLELAQDKPSEFKSPAHVDDISAILFTSGTTGFPKAILHTNNACIRTAVRALEVLGTDSGHRIHVFLPLFHGWAYMLMVGALYHKCTIVLEDRFHADTYWETIERYKITQDHWTGTVPINLMKLAKTEFEEKVNLGVIGTFGALYDLMNHRWPQIRFHSLYGQTEHAFITEVPPDAIKRNSDGIAKFPDEVMIFDDTGNQVPPGEAGEIVCRCRCGAVMKGYYNDPEATAKTLKGGDLYTGDLGYLDEEGHLHFVGRKKDALRVRGEMVSVEYIEHLIHAHPKIAECAIVGFVPPEKQALKEDEIVSHLVLRDHEQMTAEEFHEWSERNLARFMRPRYVFFRDDLPKTATERVKRYKLREEGIAGATKLF